MQALMQQAQKMQKEMQKKQAELEAQTFDVTSAVVQLKLKSKDQDKLRVLKLIKTLLIQKKKKC